MPLNRPTWLTASILAVSLFTPARHVAAQHLWWNLEGASDATCLYGEIQVLATHPGIYYCGANWAPGEPAGGYCGIQHNGPNDRRTIFSIWDTARDLHPQVTEADSHTIFNRFGGEGTGAHTHMIWPWQTVETFRFFVKKSPGKQSDTTDACFYVYDGNRKKWLGVATINSPNGGKRSVATFGGGLNSFLENFMGKDRDEPKLVLFRIWLGSSVDKLKCLTRATGDGKWGELKDSYFLAEGSDDKVISLFAKLERDYGKPTFGGKSAKLKPISDRPLPAETIDALESLPRTDTVNRK
jgi:Domain of unknown function (DUF3472)